MKKKEFSLRQATEEPLKKIDNSLKEYANLKRAKILQNYRDYPSRTIYLMRKRNVKYVQIKFCESASNIKTNEFYYSVFICSYSIKLPFLCFWNMYFDIESTKCNEVGLLKSPIIFENFIALVGKVFD